MAEKYVKLADVKRKVNYILTHNGCSPQTQRAVKDALNNLPYTVKAELETTLEAADVKPVDKAYLIDWYISSVSEEDLPVWTEEHIKELCQDFYVIPKED